MNSSLLSVNSLYSQLPEGARKDIDYAYELKARFRQVIDEINRSSEIKELKSCSSDLHNLQTEINSCQWRHDKLLESASLLRAESKRCYENTKRFGTWGLTQIQENGGYPRSEELPINLYVQVISDMGE